MEFCEQSLGVTGACAVFLCIAAMDTKVERKVAWANK